MTALLDLINEAKKRTAEADLATACAANAMKDSLEKLLPAGTVFNLRDRTKRNFPEYLRSVRTIGGKDHGSKIFRIEQINLVILDPRNAELASWEADATAISEKTGKDLDGSVAHSANNRGRFVRIAGSLCVSRSPEESTEDQIARMLDALNCSNMGPQVNTRIA